MKYVEKLLFIVLIFFGFMNILFLNKLLTENFKIINNVILNTGRRVLTYFMIHFHPKQRFFKILETILLYI